MELQSRTLVLQFVLSDGRTYTLRINNPDPSLQTSTILSAMNAFKSTDVILKENSTIAEIKGAYYAIVMEEEVNLDSL